jgi:hypothetical protein
MPVSKPISNKSLPRNVRREQRRWDDEETYSLALGCLGCSDKGMCGGQNKRQDGMSCLDDCCHTPEACELMCPINTRLFVDMYREVNGFDLQNVPRAAALPSPPLPPYVPLIYHNSNRVGPLEIEAAAIPLHKLYNKKDGALRYKSPAELRNAFGIAKETKLVLVGSGRDQPIENWWRLSSRRIELTKELSDLDVSMITSPNYSVFTDVPRYDNLRNIKRIALAWQEIVASGVPSALHMNGRTVQDYRRLSRFMSERTEVTDISFEFRTGGGWGGRRPFHVQHLSRAVSSLRRSINLVMIGGLPSVHYLAPAFERVVYIDTSAFMTAAYRQGLFQGNDGSILKVTASTQRGESIGPLLEANIRAMRRYVENEISASKQRHPITQAEPMQKIPDRRAFVRGVRS